MVLNGDQALALVRARHDRSAVPAGDLDRVQNQRKFVQAMLQAVSRQRNPFRIKSLIEAASENIKTDLTFTDMLLLGRKLQGAGPDGMVMATAPGQPKVIGGTWYYIVDERASSKSFYRRSGRPSGSRRTEAAPPLPMRLPGRA